MLEYSIRNARRPDAESIGAMWYLLMEHHHTLDIRFHYSQKGQKEYIHHVQQMIRARDALVLVAEEVSTKKVVGYLIGELQQRTLAVNTGTYGFISDMFVEAEYRRKGLGNQLYHEMYRWFTMRGACAIELYVAVANADSQAFWSAMGLHPFLTLCHKDLP